MAAASDPRLSHPALALRIESIADHLDVVATIAAWHWAEWGHTDPNGSLAAWTGGLEERTRREAIPTTYVALVAGRPVGSVTLVAHDMATCRDLTPWLAGLYVAPDHRGHGTGGMLVRHAEARAHAMGVQWLYLYSTTAVGLYRRLGWRAIFQQFYAGALVTVMGKDLTACGPSAPPDSNA